MPPGCAVSVPALYERVGPRVAPTSRPLGEPAPHFRLQGVIGGASLVRGEISPRAAGSRVSLEKGWPGIRRSSTGPSGSRCRDAVSEAPAWPCASVIGDVEIWPRRPVPVVMSGMSVCPAKPC